MINFRPCTAHDYPEICKLIHSEEELFLVYPNGHYPLTTEQLQHLARERTALTVATQNNKIIGFANLYNLHHDKLVFIGNVIIDKSLRGHGLGRALVKHMLNIAFNELHLPEAHISVFSNNTPALLLYYSFGFTPYEIEERTDPHGNRAALIHMKLHRK